MIELNVASLLLSMGGDRLFVNPAIGDGSVQELSVTDLLQSCSTDKAFFQPLFLSNGSMQELPVTSLLQSMEQNKVFLNPYVNNGSMQLLVFSSEIGLPGDNMQLITIDGYAPPAPPPPPEDHGVPSNSSSTARTASSASDYSTPAFISSPARATSAGGRASRASGFPAGKSAAASATPTRATSTAEIQQNGKIVINIYNSNEAWVSKLLTRL